jgi:hypothetical protein
MVCCKVLVNHSRFWGECLTKEWFYKITLSVKLDDTIKLKRSETVTETNYCISNSQFSATTNSALYASVRCLQNKTVSV